MNFQSATVTHMPEYMGRLPAPVIKSPISEQRFAEMAAFWQRFGVALVMVNESSELITLEESVLPFWQHIIRAANADLVAVLGGGVNAPTAADFFGAFELIRVPLIHQGRHIGNLGALALRDPLGEEFARCCDKWKLDRQHLRGLASEIEPHTSTIPLILEKLQQDSMLAIDADQQLMSINSLTKNLETTYEELGLVYRISREMTVPQDTAVALKTIGDEILLVSRADAVVFLVFEWGDRAIESLRGAPTVVAHCGKKHSSIEDYVKLGKMIDLDAARKVNHFIYNNVDRRPEFSWAQSWLEHVVALPIRQGDRLLAMMLAVNCNDEGDFTSIDVQLLRTVADRVAAFLDNQRLYQDLADLLMGMLHALISSVDAKDPYTCGHSERVAYFSRLIAERAGLDPHECERVYLAGLLHDVGKIGIPDAILTKPGKLTDEEFTVLKQHPQIGAHILDHVRQVDDLIPAVLHHHERMDGRGYPRGLAGDEIPLLGRIVCLADCFDAMTTNRTYRSALPVKSAIAEIRRCSGTQFDPLLSDLLLDLDLEQLMTQARQSSSIDRTLGQSGALHTVMRNITLDPKRTLAARGKGATANRA